jgi:hypothetical protein
MTASKGLILTCITHQIPYDTWDREAATDAAGAYQYIECRRAADVKMVAGHAYYMDNAVDCSTHTPR